MFEKALSTQIEPLVTSKDFSFAPMVSRALAERAKMAVPIDFSSDQVDHWTLKGEGMPRIAGTASERGGLKAPLRK